MKKFFNILLGLLLAVSAAILGYVLYAAIIGGADAFANPTLNNAISVTIIWAYFLFVFALASALFCAVFGMIKSPAGLKGTALSLALVILVIGASYFYSTGHTVTIANIGDGGVFGATETVITEVSILVAYAAFAGAFVVALVTEVFGAFK